MALTLDDIKKMPPKRKAFIVALILIVLGAAYYSLFLQSSLQKKRELDAKLSHIQGQIIEKQRLAAQKEKYEREVAALRETLKIALAKLPDQREIPGLLYAVAQAGKDSGIDFLLFEPKQAEKKLPEQKPGEQKPPDTKGSPPKPPEEKFYDEIPVKVTVNGGFHNAVVFFDKVAKLPRIINIEDITMTESKDVKEKRKRHITTSCIIKTYMFVEKMEEKKADGKK